ncbi:MAG: Na(+)/H(+) antiporter subunit D [Burkholderiales bacterium]
MSADFPVALILMAGSLALPLLRGHWRSGYMLLLPVVAFLLLLEVPHGSHAQVEFLGYMLSLMRVDRLSLLFGYVFLIAVFLNVIFSLHDTSATRQVAGLFYAGAALGAVFAGDLLTLFLYWELTAVSSVLLIWSGGTPRAFRAGMRYVIVHLGSGMLLLAGTVLHLAQGGSVEFGKFALDSAGSWLILAAFGVKCSFPLLHNWLQDAYPESSATGMVVLSAFTTKLGIYALARGFPGTELLVWIGTVMTLFPIFYAVIENDLRRVLAYSVTNQLGFMVVGIGIGTEMAVNGAVAHAFADILFKALLLMSMGAVLLRTGTTKGSELGGLYKSMPWTTGFCIVGAASISAFPLFSGFVTKSMIMAAVAGEGHVYVWLVLLFASAGVLEHAGIKIPYFAFFAHDSGKRCTEAPLNMLVAMAMASALCIGIGVFPGALYALLPHPVEYVPYTASHVLMQLQLLVFAILAVFVLIRNGWYPPEIRALNLDFDWTYRRLLPALGAGLHCGWRYAATAVAAASVPVLGGVLRSIRGLHQPSGLLASTWSTGGTALWMMILLLVYLIGDLL